MTKAAWVIAAIVPNLAFGWGEDGHKVVGQVAETLLSPEVRAEVMELYTPDYDSLAEYGTWADRVRGNEAFAAAAPWHYVNVQKGATTIDRAGACPPERGCALTVVEAEAARVADPGVPLWRRRQALAWLVHVVGDLHQPMHVGHKEDRGGNLLVVSVDGQRQSLHRYWDTTVVEGMASRWEDLAQELLREASADALSQARTAVEPAQWAEESRWLAASFAYDLPTSTKVHDGAEPPRRYGPKMSPSYRRRSQEVARERLLQAGVRLAALLERAFRADPPLELPADAPGRPVPKGLDPLAWHSTATPVHDGSPGREVQVVLLLPSSASKARGLPEVEAAALAPDVLLAVDQGHAQGGWSEMLQRFGDLWGGEWTMFRDYFGPDDHPTLVASRLPFLESGPWRDPTRTDTNVSWARLDIPGTTDLWVVAVDLPTRSRTRCDALTALQQAIDARVPAADHLVLGGAFETRRNRGCLEASLPRQLGRSSQALPTGMMSSDSLLPFEVSAGLPGWASGAADVRLWVSDLRAVAVVRRLKLPDEAEPVVSQP